MTSRPHDALFRSAFERPEDAAAELRAVLPVPVVAAIDWHTLRAEPGSFVDPALADRHSDLLFSASLAGRPAFLYLLMEHQSEPDPRMPLRMLVYMVRIWERCVRELADDPLPVVIPIVVSHGLEGWTAPTRLHELVSPPPVDVPGLAELVPDFRIVVDDLTRCSNDELRARALAQFPMLALWLLRDSRSADTLFQNLGAWAHAFEAVVHAPSGAHALHKLLRYLDLVLTKLQFTQFHVSLARLAPTIEREAMTGYGEQLIADTQRKMLVKLLTRKFGAVDEASQARIGAATADELEQWFERLLEADRLDLVFAQ